jgi:hypothetical protein
LITKEKQKTLDFLYKHAIMVADRRRKRPEGRGIDFRFCVKLKNIDFRLFLTYNSLMLAEVLPARSLKN